MARRRSSSWLMDGKSFARKVTNASASCSQQIRDCGASRECPNCHCRIDNSDVSPEWPGMPAGIKFDPSDAQLLQHLEAKCDIENAQPHLFIDEFIPTLEDDRGINYTHPENLPGAKKDGSSVYFFHRTTNAYATGQRKRRKIDGQNTSNEELVRWHKTGKTKPLIVDGVHKGWKKIMVLYKTSKKSKPNKFKWVMHQYHLGDGEEEKEGQFVVSKILYQQPKQSDKTDDSPITEDPSTSTLRSSPRTPKQILPDPPRTAGKSVTCDDIADEPIPQSSAQPIVLADDMRWLAGESQTVESNLNYTDKRLLCEENISSSAQLNNSELNNISSTGFAQNMNEVTANSNASHGYSELENLELDTPPDFQGVPQHAINHGDDNMGYLGWWLSESQAVESQIDDSLLRNIDASSFSSAFPGLSELENLPLCPAPDFNLDELEFNSNDSMFGDF